ncbi:MAG: hypothetical protein KGP28_11900 [Bdellovibrionales bacterium]|nr:hypothetical protein [Bdellovibrionales bacterium]
MKIKIEGTGPVYAVALKPGFQSGGQRRKELEDHKRVKAVLRFTNLCDGKGETSEFGVVKMARTGCVRPKLECR